MKDYQQALDFFQSADPILYRAALQYDPIILFKYAQSNNYFEQICRNIAGQQLSTKAAQTIWSRFIDLLPQQTLEPTGVLSLEHETMRSAGLSNAKARYIRGIAEAVVNKDIDLTNLDSLSNDKVVRKLTKLKGVGVWTAEMFLMFTLHRPDIFSVGDLGLRRAIEKLYQLDKPTNQELIELAQQWSPFRTYACRILWESLDNNPMK